MVRRTNTKLVEIQKPDLKVAPEVKTVAYNDINLKNWKDYGHVMTDTLWEFPTRLREGGHSNEYHGNFIPQIVQQFYYRYTKENDIVLDMFFGSGTSGIEAINMNRRCIGVELKDEQAEKVSEKFTPKQLVTDVNIICADSASQIAVDKVKARLDIMRESHAQFLVLHPPYDDIIKFSDREDDLSNCGTTEEFYNGFEKVARNGYELLEDKRFAALVIGDKYSNGELISLGFECQERMKRVGFVHKATIVKDMQGNERCKGKDANLWRYRALAGGFNNFKHEYIMIFQKDEARKRKIEKLNQAISA